MTPSAVTQPVAAVPDDPVRMALDDPELQEGLVNHALAILGRRLSGRPAPDRMDKAKEACQETYVRALQKRHGYDSARPVGPWLHGIMNYVLFETIRSLRRSPAQESADAAAWERLKADLDSDAAEVVPSRIDVDGYMAKLPSEHKAVLQLRFYEGLGHDDIAERLGISIGNARVRLCRALIAARIIAGVDPKEDRP
jgi:RNA polymerase sigma factor (sigma-70 family)